MYAGVIGMGIMGRPMATNLLRAGHTLAVWNRTRERCASLESQGAFVATSPADLAQRCEVIITIVTDTPDVESVLFGPRGVAEGLSPGKVVIDMSTISPTATVQFAQRLEALGCEMLDAPVSGGDVGAQQGTLAIMVGGNPEAFARCRPVFEAIGRTIVHVGPHGAGQKTKLVNQIIGALHILAMAEGLCVARAGGLDPRAVLQVVSQGAAGSWMLSNLAPRALDGDHRPGFMIRLQQKDLRLAREWIDELAIEAPGTALSLRLFTEAVERGLGELGTQGMIRLFERPSPDC